MFCFVGNLFRNCYINRRYFILSELMHEVEEIYFANTGENTLRPHLQYIHHKSASNNKCLRTTEIENIRFSQN